MSFQNPGPGEIKALLEKIRTIAVVGLSPDPDRPSYSVAMYLKNNGYHIVPVNPGVTEVLGEKAYERLADIPFPVDVVDCFRRSSKVGVHVDEAIAIGARAVWMQEGVIDVPATERARKAGLFVVMDLCMLKEHRKAGLSNSRPPKKR